MANNRQENPVSVNRIVGGAAALILILALVTFVTLLTSYRGTIRQQETDLHNLSLAFGAQTLSAVESVDQALAEVQREYVRTAGSGAGIAEIAHKRLRFHMPAHPYLLGIYLFDSSNRLLGIASSSGEPPITDAETNIIAPPMLGATQSIRIDITDIDAKSGQGILNFSRRLVDASGKVVGVMLARVDSAALQRLYTLVRLGIGGSVTLLDLDGTMLVRGPTLAQWVGKSLKDTPLFTKYLPVSEHDAFEATSPVDGKRRIYGYDVVEGYPLVIITGIDKADALIPWYSRLWMAAISLAALTLLVLFLAWRVASDSKRKLALIAKLESSEGRLEKSADYLNKILNAIGNPISVLDSSHRIVMINAAFGRLAGKQANEPLDHADPKTLYAESAHDWGKIYAQVLQSGEDIVVESELTDGQGQQRTVLISASRLTDTDGNHQIVKVSTDITEHKEALVRLAYLADFDPLTGLPNHAHFRRILEEQVARTEPSGTRLEVLIVSLERLQEINDLLGHEAGDIAVKIAGNAFRAFFPRTICTARIKSNEFAVLIACRSSEGAPKNLAEELQGALAAPITMFGREFYLGPVIGAAIYPQDAQAADELLRLADLAKHRAAEDGREPVHFFYRNTHISLDEQLALEGQLRRALEREEFRVVYQPQVEFASGRIVGFEALLRWTNATFGDVSPARFIPIAESTGLIVDIGAWVLEQACGQASRWHAYCGEQLKVAVNLSARQFHQRNLIPTIKRCIEKTRIPPGSLELEITESTVMSGANDIDRLMHEIRALDVDLSVDDFGTGYSSLAYLKRFPVQRLKIDRAFIHDLDKDEDSITIVRSIVNLGHGLKLRVVAEGVETAEQSALLKELACDEYQGYFFSRPVERDDVLGLLDRNRLSRLAPGREG